MTTAKEGSAAGKAAQQQEQVRPRRRSRSRRDRAHSGSDCGAAVTFPHLCARRRKGGRRREALLISVSSSRPRFHISGAPV